MKNGMYFGGIPTSPDVNRIRESFPDSSLSVVTYEEIEKVLGCDRGTNRFKAVTNRWRKLVEKESGKVIGVEAGKGFKVLNETEKLDLGCQKFASAVRLGRRSFVVTGLVDRKGLSSEDASRLDHMQKRAASVLAAAQVKPTAVLPTM